MSDPRNAATSIRIDAALDAALRRDTAIINERIHIELGFMPIDGIVLEAKRKPVPFVRVEDVPASAPYPSQEWR
jgi:hypothetical protein